MFRKGIDLASGVRILGRHRRRRGPFRVLLGGHRIELANWQTRGGIYHPSMLPPNCELMRGEGDVLRAGHHPLGDRSCHMRAYEVSG
jgi:hypothetical protein